MSAINPKTTIKVTKQRTLAHQSKKGKQENLLLLLLLLSNNSREDRKRKRGQIIDGTTRKQIASW